jgi:hypothetical protein
MGISVSGSIASIVAPLSRLASGNGLRAVQDGLTEGGDKVRTKVRKALKAQTNPIKYATITSRVDGKRNGFSYFIEAKGGGLPIKEFPHSAPGSVSASPWGVARTFKRSFVKAGGALVARLTRKRFPVRKLYGPSLSKELVKDQSLAAFEVGVRADVVPAIDKRLARLLR